MFSKAEIADPEHFRLRARTWLEQNMPRLAEGLENRVLALADEDGNRARELQKRLHAGGFAGLCFPPAYGGQGLSYDHQQVFSEEARDYEMPTLLDVPTLAILVPTLLEFGTEEQKRRHVGAILAGEAIWVQLLSEPTNGSDLAGVTTRATRDGDQFILNGSKIWTSGAFRADYAVCLARTDWQAPKHRGLTMFIIQVRRPEVEVRRIRRVNGNLEFCQEFLNDVAVPASDVLGQVNEGWSVATALLGHEREAAGGASRLISGFSGGADDAGQMVDLLALVRAAPRTARERARQLVAEAFVDDKVHQQLVKRVRTAVLNGSMPPQAGALLRLMAATTAERRADIGLELAGSAAGAASSGAPGLAWARHYLYRQGSSLAGGSNEMQRNLISERLLGMPREAAPDVGVPFNEVRHNAQPKEVAGD